jgi:hypothetical protein
VGDEKLNVPDGRQIDLQATHHYGEGEVTVSTIYILPLVSVCLDSTACFILNYVIQKKQNQKEEGKGGN